MLRVVALVLSLMLLDGCAAVKDSGRAQLVVPSEVGAVYSEVELQAQLALVPADACSSGRCDADAFRRRVAGLARRLAAAAGGVATELELDPADFSVEVVGKDDVGTLSSASGRIVVFDGVRGLALDDPALAFVVAREMGHVLARHHEENTASGLAVSAAVALLFPVTGLLQGVEAAYRTSSIATTATSFAGSRAVRSLYEEDQRREADGYAMRIVMHAGWTPRDVSRALAAAVPRLEGDDWIAELRESRCWLDAIVSGPQPEDADVADIPSEYFGSGFEPGMRWVGRLLGEAQRRESVCRLPLPAARPASATARSAQVARAPAQVAKSRPRTGKHTKRPPKRRARPR